MRNKKVYHTERRPVEEICTYKCILNQLQVGDQWVDPKTKEVWEYKVISDFVVKSIHWAKLSK